ncbi:5-methyltetrahydropteroyltriglutamate--homocysteine S-methyltransferase [Salinisphaera sp. Q1T1-3]|uniref:5-methyltetrahydropteroyltriglutamate-- homocysteine S-methyltransferase n=1 Tax=Salinisphaera sp. Q1T1-3 TaxID=2321229 RepID=UPI000E76DC89|nr:5-methyltetrahydropteroyltriglutamate--homocysteine S-methyltransferase [Salinisphaera sp. Q1T1-3]RJS91088.1 5-methyltetrahydropteroyltriglutamate--homocysteine S-methyltransferase [Salinisphaera sp. Q1T1-3]
MSHRVNPPFRAEQVGSLLRPPKVQAARRRYAEGDISAAELRALEDVAIAEIVRRQEEVGMQDVTDGELRRAYFHLDFLKQLDGVTVTGGINANQSAKSADDGFKPPQLSVSGKLAHARPIQVEDFAFLDSKIKHGTAKVAIPSPTMVHFRGGRAAIDIEAYPEMDAFFADLAACYRDEIAALHAVGCRYLQLDDTNLAYLCDPQMRQAAADRGDDPNELPRQYAALINDALRDRPDDMTVGIHLCRGNYRSTWFAEGGYEPVAEVLFNELNVDAYFLEYDDERSGDFAPLRFVPKDKTVVLGLVSSKVPALESVATLAKRIDEAAAYAPLDQLCLSPQCGFSSTAEGNEITMETQWAKLARVVETAETVWGR